MEKEIRLLELYTTFIRGGSVSKSEAALKYQVNERTIQRDIDDIRAFLYMQNSEGNGLDEIIYDKKLKRFRLETSKPKYLTKEQVLSVCKILLDSRAFVKSDMEDILDTIVGICQDNEDRKIIKSLINNEKYHYFELKNSRVNLNDIWKIGNAIYHHNKIEIQYNKPGKNYSHKRGGKSKTFAPPKEQTVKINPLAILFSEFYFYLLAFPSDEKLKNDFDLINDSEPTIYRIDRISSINVLKDRFKVPYKGRVEEGEFRKRFPFMNTGKLHKVKFFYYGNSAEYILDKIPTAKIVDKEPDKELYVIEAEAYGTAIDDWLDGFQEKIKLST